jgi:predicted transcriptional regulator
MKPQHLEPYGSVIETIGWTPLIRLSRVGSGYLSPIGGLTESALMTRALAQPALLERPVREVMGAPFPVVDASFPTDRLAPMLTRENPSTPVQEDGKLVGIVSSHDLLQQLIPL